ncbi:MAG TPA: AgmX/PglI C-terminal domain-containing protein [Haliangiales bacterium]|nr:AgmX/PglI C-terminal domain-containing protein [Haliangiales bacterium]
MVLRVVQSWHQTVMDDRTFHRRHVVVGHGPRGHFFTPDLGLPPLYALFSRGWKGWRVALGPGMKGEVNVAGETQPIEDILAVDEGVKKRRRRTEWRAVALSPGDWGVVKLGADAEHSFFFQVGPVERKIPTPPTPFHGDTIQSWGLSIVFHAAAFALTFLFLTWPPPGGSVLGGYVIHLSQQPPKAPEKDKKEKVKEPSAGIENGEDKAKPTATADKEGKQGGKGEKQRAASPKADPKAAMREKVSKVGVLAHANVLSDIAGGAPPTLNLPINRLGDAGYGPGRGTGVGPGIGGTGTSTRGGSGAGGGGKGLADVVTHGPIDTGNGRPPRGSPAGTRVTETKVGLQAGTPEGEFGGLTPEQVRKVVEAHRAAIQYCFDKELQRNTKLSGKVVVYWRIEPAGAVSASRIQSSTVGSPDVEGCLVRTVRKWSFPAAANGQTTDVRFPFVFSAR